MYAGSALRLSHRGASVALAAVCLSMPVASRAQQFAACMKSAGGVSSAMLDCGKSEIDRWDLRLNAAYRILVTGLAPDARARLQAEQRAWLKQHRTETSRLAGAPDNGSVAFLESQAFELTDLQQRTQTLERRAWHVLHPRRSE